jgi:dTDP-4-amino-4,6-dideoxygalactose transaminase
LKENNTKLSVPNLQDNELDYVNDAILANEFGPRGSYITKFENGLKEVVALKAGLAL